VRRYRVTAAKVEVRVTGVLTTHFYGEVVTLDESAAQRLVADGSLTPEPTLTPGGA
jgi:hypothetical protein